MVNHVNNLGVARRCGRNVCLLSAKVGTNLRWQNLWERPKLGGGGGGGWGDQTFEEIKTIQQSLNTGDLYYFKQTSNGESLNEIG